MWINWAFGFIRNKNYNLKTWEHFACQTVDWHNFSFCASLKTFSLSEATMDRRRRMTIALCIYLYTFSPLLTEPLHLAHFTQNSKLKFTFAWQSIFHSTVDGQWCGATKGKGGENGRRERGKWEMGVGCLNWGMKIKVVKQADRKRYADADTI